MQEHAASPAVQQFCCSALANLAEYPPAKNEIVEEGGIPLVLQVLAAVESQLLLNSDTVHLSNTVTSRSLIPLIHCQDTWVH